MGRRSKPGETEPVRSLRWDSGWSRFPTSHLFSGGVSADSGEGGRGGGTLFHQVRGDNCLGQHRRGKEGSARAVSGLSWVSREHPRLAWTTWAGLPCGEPPSGTQSGGGCFLAFTVFQGHGVWKVQPFPLQNTYTHSNIYLHIKSGLNNIIFISLTHSISFIYNSLILPTLQSMLNSFLVASRTSALGFWAHVASRHLSETFSPVTVSPPGRLLSTG